MIERYQGCLIGLAVGDALGAPVEFLSLQKIKEKYGSEGIVDLDRWGNFVPGTYTDDTQMSLATAIGLIKANQSTLKNEPNDDINFVYRHYMEWFETQKDPQQRRGPGHTCLSALGSGEMGTPERKFNNSKGCGGVMRTAPAGLAFPPGVAFLKGCKFAAITHGHPSGYLPAGFLAEMIAWILAGKNLDESIESSLSELVKYRGHTETVQKVNLARTLARSSVTVEEAVRQIGEGWVGEEALAVAVYCSLKLPKNWEKAVLAAVNHSGDSDSTASITGAILGALLGIQGVPDRWVRSLENSGMILSIANDLYRVFQEKITFT